MKQVSRWILLPLLLLGWLCYTQAGSACGYGVGYSAISYGYSHYQAPVYKQKEYIPLAILLPVATYGAGYQDKTPAPASAEDVKGLRRDFEELKKLLTPPPIPQQATPPPAQPQYQHYPQPREVLPQKVPAQSPYMPPAQGYSEHEPVQGPAPPVQAQAQGSLAYQQCARCHEQKAAADKGGGLALFSGYQHLRLSESTNQAVLNSILSGKMPRCKGCQPLTMAERSAVISSWLNDHKQVAHKQQH